MTIERMSAHAPASRRSGCAGTRIDAAFVIAHPPCMVRRRTSSAINEQNRTKALTARCGSATLMGPMRAANAFIPKSILAFDARFHLR
jgi:hypothetical protein